MKMLLVILTAFFSLAAVAAEKQPTTGNYEQFFLVNGKRTTGEEAIMSAIRGTPAYKCQSVEAKLSKSGTSVGLRNIKKPRVN